MAVDPFLDEDSRVLTPEAFDFVLNNELKRAMRSQNFLTLLVIEATEATPEGGGPRQLARELARVVSREVRETDLISRNDEGRLSVVLLDADLPNSMRVLERLMTRFEHYEFTSARSISVGAACCPTHGADAESLLRAAEVRPMPSRRESRGSASNSQ
jgi:diguanylate cyclase with GGDEF domain